MKLNKEYFRDPKNAKHMPSGALRSRVSAVSKKYLGTGISSGELFVIDNDLDKKAFAKLDKTITDWDKQETNVWLSAFHRAIKLHYVPDRTTYLIYVKR